MIKVPVEVTVNVAITELTLSEVSVVSIVLADMAVVVEVDVIVEVIS